MCTADAARRAFRDVHGALLATCAIALQRRIVAPQPAPIVGGTDQVSDSFAAPVAFIEISAPPGIEACSGTLISPTVVMTAAHCVYRDEPVRRRCSASPTRPTSRYASDRATSRIPRSAPLRASSRFCRSRSYRWDGTRHFHDIALLALDRALPADAGGARRAAARPGQGAPDRRLRPRVGDDARRRRAASRHDRRSRVRSRCRRSSRRPSIHPGCSAARPRDRSRPMPGGHRVLRRLGRPGVRAREHRPPTSSSRASSATAREPTARSSRSYLVLVASERGFIDRALATPPQAWAASARRSAQRDDQAGQAARRPGGRGLAAHRRRSAAATRASSSRFYTRAGKRLSHAYRSVATNRWVRFRLMRQMQRFTGYVCAQGADSTGKPSNIQCAPDVVLPAGSR